MDNKVIVSSHSSIGYPEQRGRATHFPVEQIRSSKRYTERTPFPGATIHCSMSVFLSERDLCSSRNKVLRKKKKCISFHSVRLYEKGGNGMVQENIEGR